MVIKKYTQAKINFSKLMYCGSKAKLLELTLQLTEDVLIEWICRFSPRLFHSTVYNE